MQTFQVENFLEEDLWKESYETAISLLKRNERMFCTSLIWDQSIIKESTIVLIHEVNRESLLFKRLYDRIEKIVNDHTNGYSIKGHEIMFYYWTKNSYIPWHTDKDYGGAVTIYLNDNWDVDDGGFFLYEEPSQNGKYNAVFPKGNRAMMQFGGVNHSTTPVISNKIRVTIQTFLEKK